MIADEELRNAMSEQSHRWRPRGASAPASQAYGAPPHPFAEPERPPLLVRLFPLLGSLKGYAGAALRVDAVAGVTVAALAIPSAMGYASIAGLPVQAGLYALLLPVLVYAVMSSSPRMVIGPEGAVAAMVASALVPLAAAGSSEYIALAAALAILVGVVSLVARFARVGKLTDFMSIAVLVGYITGIAITLIVGQLEKLTGIPVEADKTIAQLVELVRNAAELDPLTTTIGVATVALLLLSKRLMPRLPAALVIVVVGIALSAGLDWAGSGVATVGAVPSGLPVPSIPWDGLARTLELVPAAVGIFFVSYSDAILTARSFAARHQETVDASTELTALGAADVAAGLTGGFPIGVSGSRSSVNDQMGVLTQVGQLIAVAVVSLVLLFLTEPIQYLPLPVLAGIIIAAVITLIVPADWRELARSSRAEVAIAALTVAGVVLVGVVPALLVAMLLSLIDFARRAAHPRDAVIGWLPQDHRFADIERRPDADVVTGVVVYRYDARLFYANAAHFKERLSAAVDGAPYPVHTVVLDASAFSDTDATAAQAVGEAVAGLTARGVRLYVAELGSWSYQEFRELGLVEAIGEDRFYPTVVAAVTAATEHVPGAPDAS